MSDSDEVLKRLPRWVAVLEGILAEAKKEKNEREPWGAGSARIEQSPGPEASKK
jgi:hypothetical protein